MANKEKKIHDMYTIILLNLGESTTHVNMKYSFLSEVSVLK